MAHYDDLEEQEYAALIQLLGEFLPDTVYAQWSAEHTALSLRDRAEAMMAYVKTSGNVSDAVIACVLGGKQYIAQIWDARTQGTHGQPVKQLVIDRYKTAGVDIPKDHRGKLVGCLTPTELQDGSAAGREFSDWLQNNKPVNAIAAIRKFQEIGGKYASSDTEVEFILPLERAHQVLAWLARERM